MHFSIPLVYVIKNKYSIEEETLGTIKETQNIISLFLSPLPTFWKRDGRVWVIEGNCYYPLFYNPDT